MRIFQYALIDTSNFHENVDFPRYNFIDFERGIFRTSYTIPTLCPKQFLFFPKAKVGYL